jgi:hypothetical protein
VALHFKKGDPRDASNYRPIALVSHPWKLYGRAIRRAISVHPAFSFHPLQCDFLPIVGAIDAANLTAEALHIRPKQIHGATNACSCNVVVKS